MTASNGGGDKQWRSRVFILCGIPVCLSGERVNAFFSGRCTNMHLVLSYGEHESSCLLSFNPILFDSVCGDEFDRISKDKRFVFYVFFHVFYIGYLEFTMKIQFSIMFCKGGLRCR